LEVGFPAFPWARRTRPLAVPPLVPFLPEVHEELSYMFGSSPHTLPKNGNSYYG
ncbi:hypothetical protein M9458_029200, partial [Cirrhinus mrigala]